MNKITIKDLAAHDDFQMFEDNGEMLWMQGTKRDRPARTADDAEIKLEKIVRLLRREAHPKAMQLATRLENAPHAPNAASPLFMRTLQRFCTDLFYQELQVNFDEWSVISVIHPNCGARLDDLDPTIFDGLGRRVREALRISGVTCALGGFDLSANEHEQEAFTPHYRPQLWFFAPTNEIRGGERVFRQCFPKSPSVRRPVLIKPWDGYPGAIAYALKPEFNRRVSLSAGNTRMSELRVSQKCEIALVMDKLDPLSRLFMYNFSIKTRRQREQGQQSGAFKLGRRVDLKTIHDI